MNGNLTNALGPPAPIGWTVAVVLAKMIATIVWMMSGTT
jgi:hypothetical protein